MAGSGGDGRGGASGGCGSSSSKEAAGMLALHEALRNVCLGSDWTYSVFWTIRPRPRCRGGNGCKVGDDNGSLMLMWEDGFCRPRVEDVVAVGGEDAVQKAFSKMSIQLYNYGEGLMGKVASDKCHKWVFKEPSECEPNISNYWQSSFDAIPPEWNDQFTSGIQTIAVIQAGHGLLQLGSCKIIPEDLHFVLRMRYMFESLGYQSGFFLSQLFSSTRNASPPPSAPVPMKQSQSSVFNLGHHSPPAPIHSHTAFHPAAQLGFLPPPSDGQMDAIMEEHDAELKWPSGMSFFTALTGRADDGKLLFSSQPPMPPQHPLVQEDHELMKKQGRRGGDGGAECEPGKGKRAEIYGKFKRSFTMPARMTAVSPAAAAATVEQYHALTPQPMDYRSSEAGIYQDIMETFLD